MTFKCNYPVIYGIFYPFLWTKMFYTFHMLHNHKVWIFSNQHIWSAWRLTFDWFTAEYHVFVENNVAIEMIYFPLFHVFFFCFFFNLNITITRNTVGVDINFKNLNFKNLTKLVLVSTMFIQRADNLAKLIGMRIILTSANWEHNVR